MTNDSRHSLDLFAALDRTDVGRSILEGMFERFAPDPGLGRYERMCTWRTCADGWIICYTTTRAVGGLHDGKYVVLAYRPIGKGARSGDPHEWQLDYHRGFAKRKDAKARSVTLWRRHEDIGKARKATR